MIAFATSGRGVNWVSHEAISYVRGMEILAAARVFVPLRRVGCFAVTAAAGSTCCFVAAAAAAAKDAETAVPWLVIVGHFYCV